MQINKLHLTNFRNHKNLKIELDKDITVISGKNGAGKTNVLEAINMLTSTKSFRAEHDTQVISFSEDFAKIGANTTKEGFMDDIELIISRNNTGQNYASKTTKINGAKKSLLEFAGRFNSVLFAPQDIEIITGSPILRRKYLNTLLIQVDKIYKHNLAEFTKAVKIRNAILVKIAEENKGFNELDYYSNKVLQTSAYLQKARQNFVEYLNKKLLEHKEDARVKLLLSDFGQNDLNLEIKAKRTLKGAHRDDLEFYLEGNKIDIYGSRGQQRKMLLTFRVIELEYIEDSISTRPILLLDDIFSELDYYNKEKVFDIVNGYQTIVSTANPEALEKKCYTIKL